VDKKLKYKQLQMALQKDLGRRIPEKDVRKYGKWLIRFYADLNGTRHAQVMKRRQRTSTGPSVTANS